MKYAVYGLLSLLFIASVNAKNYQGPYNQKWLQDAKAVTKLLEDRESREKCVETNYSELSKRFLVTRNDQGQLCKVYDLSFPTLSSLFSKKPTSTLRINKPKYADFKSFLSNKTSEDMARSFLEEDVNEQTLRGSWYRHLKFKNKSLRTTADGVVESFRFGDLKTFSNHLAFTQEEKTSLKKLLIGYGADETKVNNFTNNPRSFLDNIQFEYSSIKRAYEVFIDLDFLPIRGPITTVDHSLHYRGWLQGQIRSLVFKALDRLMMPISSRSLTGAILRVVLNDTLEMINMTYKYQKIQLEQVLRMALEGTIQTTLTRKELQDSLYLLYVEDSNMIIGMVQKLAQGVKVDINNLYTFGKSASVTSWNQKIGLSDQNFSNLYYELQCDLQSITYYFASCADVGNVYSLLSQSKFLFWDFGNTKIINLDSEWEVLLKRSVAYLLSGAVGINFLNFPNWISSNVSSALKGYALAGVLDEAYLVSEVYEKSTRGIRLTTFERQAYTEIMNKSLIPFLPRSQESLNTIVSKHKNILVQKIK